MAAPSSNAIALRQLLNERTAKDFAAAFVSLIGLFIICHWTRALYSRTRKRAVRSPVEAFIARILRTIHDVLSYKVIIGQLTVGRFLLYTIYWGINLILYLTQVDLTTLNTVAKHCGWMAICNLCLVIFLSLKNTPLAILSASSYEVLMPLHKVAGYTCIVEVWIHAIVYLSALAKLDALEVILETEPVVGMIGGISFFLIGVSVVLRRRQYELFYIIHVVLSALILIVVGLHHPEIAQKALIIIIVTATLSFADRVIRLVKYFVCSIGNYATVTALPNGATRVRLYKSAKAVPGSHAFLWIPAIRMTQTHPFTLVTSTPVEFVVRAHNGFTADLYKYAQKNGPDVRLRCSLNAGYGYPSEDFRSFDSVFLIAGGSGASFTFSVALDLVRNSPGQSPSRISFVWVVRDQDSLSWFHHELQEILASRIHVVVYISEGLKSDKLAFPIAREQSPTESKREVVVKDASRSASGSSTPSSRSTDIELEEINTPEPAAHVSGPAVHIKSGRPDVRRVIDEFVGEETVSTNRVIVGACGPQSLMDAVRGTASDYVGRSKPPVTFYHEEFGW